MIDNRRQHTRYSIAVQAEVTVDGDTCMGETRDISLGGVSVSIDREVAEKASVELALILTQDGIEDPDEEPFETEAAVMWNAPTDGGEWMLGLRFAGLGKEKTDHLQRFLAALAREQE